MSRSSNSGRRNLVTNATANWLGYAGQVVVAFFLTPVLVNALGLDRYGVWSLVESILAYLVLLDFGVGASVVRFVAKFEAVHDYRQVNRVFSASVGLFAGAGALGLALAAAAALWLLPLFERLQQHPELAWEARGLLVLLGLNFAVGLPLKVCPCVLDALGRYPAQAVVRLVGLVVRTLLLLAVAWNGGGLVPLGVVITACSLGEQLVLAGLTWCYLPELRFSWRLVDRETLRSIRGYSVDAFLAMVAGRVMFQTDAIVIGAFLPLAQITFFATAARLVEYAKDSYRAITQGLMPAVSVLEARGDNAGIRRVLFNGSRYVLWLVLPVQVGLMTLGKPFLALWMRRDPEIAEASYPSLLILAAPMALALPQAVAARILYGTGRLRWFARAAMAEAVGNLALSLALVGPLGIEGVALGTALPNVVGSVALLAYVCRYLDVPLRRYLGYVFAVPVAAALPLAGAWWWAARSLALDTWPALVGTGAAGLAGYLVLAALAELGPRRLAAGVRSAWRRLLPGRATESAEVIDQGRSAAPWENTQPQRGGSQ
jgi:O-antigen/teichoic acid export membrane protein